MEQLLSPNETVVIYRRNSCSMAYATVVPLWFTFLVAYCTRVTTAVVHL